MTTFILDKEQRGGTSEYPHAENASGLRTRTEGICVTQVGENCRCANSDRVLALVTEGNFVFHILHRDGHRGAVRHVDTVSCIGRQGRGSP